MAGIQFDALRYQEGRRWELLEGDLVEVSSPTPEHQDIVFNLLAALKQYLKEQSVGRAHQDVEFALSRQDRLPAGCMRTAGRAGQFRTA